jgi:hypothetical protein
MFHPNAVTKSFVVACGSTREKKKAHKKTAPLLPKRQPQTSQPEPISYVSSRLNSNSYYSPHKHSGVTTHRVLSGELTVSYPDDAQPAKETIGVGGRFDVEAGRRHEVWVGSEGCTYVIGE